MALWFGKGEGGIYVYTVGGASVTARVSSRGLHEVPCNTVRSSNTLHHASTRIYSASSSHRF
jgi:hypothetical protein